MTIASLDSPVVDLGIEKMRLRRLVFSLLAFGTYAALGTVMGMLLAVNGWSAAKIVMLAGYLLSLPWTVLGFWNALIGFAIARFSREPAALVNPSLRFAATGIPITARIALAICVRNEDIAMVESRIATMRASLDATEFADRFDLFLLSDTSRPEIVAAEEDMAARLQASDRRPGRLTYRRRALNTGYKAGNLRDFVQRWGDRYDFFIRSTRTA